MASILHPRAASDAQIAEFWRWFQTIANEIAANFEDATLLAELDEHVSQLGDVLWELGPGTMEENALIITPDGSKEWLPVTNHIVAMAPKISGWEFKSSRPPRVWDMRFSIESTDQSHLEIDARSWRYVLFRYPDNTFDIVIEQSNLHSTSEDNRYAAAIILLDGILGEKNRLARLSGIEAVEALSPTQAHKANSIHDLAQHLDSLETN